MLASNNILFLHSGVINFILEDVIAGFCDPTTNGRRDVFSDRQMRGRRLRCGRAG
jgi:hypothetical protein